MKRKDYVAYGSNLNIEQMTQRCPGAILKGTGVIKNYELQFKGRDTSAFATIAPKKGAETPIAIWSITEADERWLDRYEGFPTHYFKEDVPVEVEGKVYNAMAYVMNLRADFAIPSPYYYGVVAKGYDDCGLDKAVLEDAVSNSARRFYQRSAGGYYSAVRDSVDSEDDEEAELDEEDELEEDDYDEDEDYEAEEDDQWQLHI